MEKYIHQSDICKQVPPVGFRGDIKEELDRWIKAESDLEQVIEKAKEKLLEIRGSKEAWLKAFDSLDLTPEQDVATISSAFSGKPVEVPNYRKVPQWRTMRRVLMEHGGRMSASDLADELVARGALSPSLRNKMANIYVNARRHPDAFITHEKGMIELTDKSIEEES